MSDNFCTVDKIRTYRGRLEMEFSSQSCPVMEKSMHKQSNSYFRWEFHWMKMAYVRQWPVGRYRGTECRHCTMGTGHFTTKLNQVESISSWIHPKTFGLFYKFFENFEYFHIFFKWNSCRILSSVGDFFKSKQKFSTFHHSLNSL